MRRFAVLLALLLPAGALQGQAAGAASAEERITLFPGDILQIEVWREPDLGGVFLVNDRGTVVLPLIGEMAVTGTPVPQLRDSLLSAYRRELRNASINITPLRRIYVLGEVNKPGLLNVDPTVSLAGVIALAGGANPQGDIRRIQIARNGEVMQWEIAPTDALTQLDVRSGDEIVVGRRSWFDRNSTFLVSALLSATSILITLMR